MKLYKVLPKRNRIYTIRDVVPGQRIDTLEQTVTILLKELVNPVQVRIGQEPGFAHWRFVEPEELAAHEARVAAEPAPKKKSQPAHTPAIPTPQRKRELVTL